MFGRTEKKDMQIQMISLKQNEASESQMFVFNEILHSRHIQRKQLFLSSFCIKLQ